MTKCSKWDTVVQYCSDFGRSFSSVRQDGFCWLPLRGGRQWRTVAESVTQQQTHSWHCPQHSTENAVPEHTSRHCFLQWQIEPALCMCWVHYSQAPPPPRPSLLLQLLLLLPWCLALSLFLSLYVCLTFQALFQKQLEWLLNRTRLDLHTIAFTHRPCADGNQPNRSNRPCFRPSRNTHFLCLLISCHFT